MITLALAKGRIFEETLPLGVRQGCDADVDRVPDAPVVRVGGVVIVDAVDGADDLVLAKGDEHLSQLIANCAYTFAFRTLNSLRDL